MRKLNHAGAERSLKISVLLHMRSELLRAFRPEVDDNSCTQAHLIDNLGMLAQPILLGRRLADFMHADESNPRATGNQSINGIRDLALPELANPGSKRCRTIDVPRDTKNARGD